MEEIRGSPTLSLELCKLACGTLDKSPAWRNGMAATLALAARGGMLALGDLMAQLACAAALLGDMAVDVPKIANYFGEVGLTGVVQACVLWGTEGGLDRRVDPNQL